MKNRERLLIASYLAALVWLNAYLCREVFFFEHIGQMNSMHGFWMGLARLAGDVWYKPAWWRYSYDGMPFEYTYAPLVPGLIAGISKLAGWSLGRAFGVVAGFVFCFGPVAMFLMTREITRRAGWSFVAAATYSLTAPSQLFAPDAEFGLRHLHDARRILLTFSWDDVPHELALALVCLSVLFLVRGLRGWKAGSFVWAGFWFTLALLASAFGVTAMLFVLVCLGISWQTGDWKRNSVALALCGLLAYLAMSPFLPPSLVAVIHRNANFSTDAWTWVSFLTLGGVAAGGLLLNVLLRGRVQWHVRFFGLLAYGYSAIPVLERWNLHFLPQPERYKIEMEVWLVLLAAFAAAQFIDRTPRAARATLALLLLWPAAAQVKAHRRFAKEIIRSSDVHETIEYQVADWLNANLPDGRVFAPGTIGQWMSAFTRQQQFGGGSYPTIPTLPMQFAIKAIPYVGTFKDSVELTRLWLEAYGVDALVVPGPLSPEYWKPFRVPERFAGSLPLLWHERDTSIYAVPRTRVGLAHVIPGNAIVKEAPQGFSDADAIRAYVTQLENPANPPAEWHWIDDNHGRIETRLTPGDIISLQITYHAGWKAVTDGKPAAIVPDGLAQMVIHADCAGLCEVDLSYDGGWEAKGLRILSLATILGAAWWGVTSLRRRKVARISTS